MAKICVAIVGVGNCASSLVQGLEYYRGANDTEVNGLMHPVVGDWRATDIEVVGAFDIDRRKVGKPLEQAIFAKPNCTTVFQAALPASSVIVQMGPILDGVADAHGRLPRRAAFRPADARAGRRGQGAAASPAPRCWSATCRSARSRRCATTPQACLDAGVAMVNCVPVFIASDPEWAARFREARPADRRRRHQEPGRRHHRPPHAVAAVRRPRRQPRPHLPAQHRRQHRLPQHARA